MWAKAARKIMDPDSAECARQIAEIYAQRLCGEEQGMFAQAALALKIKSRQRQAQKNSHKKCRRRGRKVIEKWRGLLGG